MPYYGKAAFIKTILLFFLYMNFTHEKILLAFNLSTMKICTTIEMFVSNSFKSIYQVIVSNSFKSIYPMPV